MQFSSLLVAAAAFAFANAAKFTNPAFNGITAGKAFNISWTDAAGPVTITLKNGDPNALKTVSVIASGQTGTSYVWDVPATLPADTYALQIDDGGAPNYSTQWQIINGVTSSSSSMSMSVTSSMMTGNSTTTAGSSTTTSGSSSSTTTGTNTKSTSPSRTGSGSTSSGSGTGTAVPNSNSASGLASNLALVFLGVAAFIPFN